MGELRSSRFTETSTTPATELQKSLVGIPFERTPSPFCVKHRIDPAITVRDGAEMNLVIANDQVRKWLGIRACRAGGRESFFLIVRTSRLQEALIFSPCRSVSWSMLSVAIHIIFYSQHSNSKFLLSDLFASAPFGV